MLDEMRALLVDVRRVAPKITVPTFVVQGMDDRVVLPRYTRAFAMKLGGRLAYREIPGDHYLPLEWLPGWPNLRDIIVDELRKWMASANDRD
jgi:pimeloyl-ACP methyl ester carboxylesterase